jgi:hypothetical protein
VPDGWELTVIDPLGFRLRAPGASDERGFAPSVAFRRAGEAQLELDVLEDIATRTRSELEAGQSTATILGERRFFLSSLCPVYACTYERDDPATGRRFTHLQATIADWYAFTVDGVTAELGWGGEMDQLHAILDSVRLIPEPDDLSSGG